MKKVVIILADDGHDEVQYIGGIGIADIARANSFLAHSLHLAIDVTLEAAANEPQPT